jgi:signal peptidase I
MPHRAPRFSRGDIVFHIPTRQWGYVTYDRYTKTRAMTIRLFKTMERSVWKRRDVFSFKKGWKYVRCLLLAKECRLQASCGGSWLHRVYVLDEVIAHNMRRMTDTHFEERYARVLRQEREEREKEKQEQRKRSEKQRRLDAMPQCTRLVDSWVRYGKQAAYITKVLNGFAYLDVYTQVEVDGVNYFVTEQVRIGTDKARWLRPAKHPMMHHYRLPESVPAKFTYEALPEPTPCDGIADFASVYHETLSDGSSWCGPPLHTLNLPAAGDEERARLWLEDYDYDWPAMRQFDERGDEE